MAATHIPTVVILDNDDDDDDIRILDSNPILIEKGSSSSNPISIDTNSSAKDGTFRTRKRQRVIHINCNDDDDDQNDADHKSTCEICTDEKPRSEFFRIKGCAHCYCTDCTTKYVSSKLQENSTKIGCPFPGCLTGILEIQDCRWILPGEVFDRWGAALCEATIPPSEKFYCPFKDCSALMIQEEGQNYGVPNMVCPNCNRMFCAKCRVAWHSGISCQRFSKLKRNERGEDDIKFFGLAEQNRWRRCPRCRAFVEKNGGCDIMSCRCGTSFNYGSGHLYPGIRRGRT